MSEVRLEFDEHVITIDRERELIVIEVADDYDGLAATFSLTIEEACDFVGSFRDVLKELDKDPARAE